MTSFSADVEQLGLARPEIMTMKKFFDAAKQLPATLITQHQPLMKMAYVSVTADVWGNRCMTLEMALTTPSIPKNMRRTYLVPSTFGLTGTVAVDDVLDQAFRQKFNELYGKVIHDFKDFFPYRISRSDHKLMVFEKLNDMGMIEYVLNRLSSAR